MLMSTRVREHLIIFVYALLYNNERLSVRVNERTEWNGKQFSNLSFLSYGFDGPKIITVD